MDNKVLEKLDKLVNEGKITPEEKEELLEAMGIKKETTQASLGLPEEIEIQGFKSADLEISGDNSVNCIIIEEGSEFIDTKMEGSTLKIYPEFLGRKIFGIFGLLRIKLRMPSSVQEIAIKLVSGDLNIYNMSSRFLISLVSGDVKISQVDGKLNVNAISGDISIDDFNGEAEVVTKSGDIKVGNSKIKGILKTYSGDISLSEAELGEFKLSTYSGDIDIEKADFKGNGEIVTYFGDIEIEGNVNDISLKTETLSGEIYGAKLIEESLNKGKPLYEITARTKSGDISLKDISKGGRNE